MKDAAVHAEIGKRLKQARKNSGLSLSEIRVATGLAQSSIWRMEQGDRAAPSVTTLIKLCRAYKCSADFILSLP